MREFLRNHRYAVCCLLSSGAALMGFVNPMLAGVVINRAVTAFSLTLVTPMLLGMGAVNGTRILLRLCAARLLGGRQRAPLIWLQRRIGKGLWWLEPVLHGWGYPGILIKKLGRWLFSHRLTERAFSRHFGRTRRRGRLSLGIASSLTYTLLDLCVTALAGLIYYLTRSYPLSLLAVLLPAFAVVPWFAKKSGRIKNIRNNCRPFSASCRQISPD